MMENKWVMSLELIGENFVRFGWVLMKFEGFGVRVLMEAVREEEMFMKFDEEWKKNNI
jgi:hypothetical protein